MQELAKEMDQMVLEGQIPQAVQAFFAENAHTKDVDGTTTATRDEALQKLTGFVGNIASVNEISLLNSATNGQVSMSEFRFHFEMKDGSEILWHEVIRREWEADKVINEVYFQN